MRTMAYGHWNRSLSVNMARRICLNYVHLFGLEQTHSIIAYVDIRKPFHCNTYSRLDGAILDRSCKACPHYAVWQP
jgi:hypothetical protein